jgi:MFS transporter, FHS family, L-fucose permease
MSQSTPIATPRYRTPFVVVTTLFFIWGFITVLVDALIPRLRAVFELSYFEAGLVQFAFFTAYLVVSIPSGFLIARIGYKKGVVVGLLTMGVGCMLFFPAAEMRIFAVFLAALFVLASGITVLQVAANPYVAALGPARTASSRLNLSQAFNSLGTTIAPLVAAAFILGSAVSSSTEIAEMSAAEQSGYYASEAAAVQGPFVVLAAVLIVLALAFARFRLPRILETDEQSRGSYRKALRFPQLKLGAVAIFVYVGAEVAIGSYLVNYFLALDIESLVSQHVFLHSLAGFLAGADPTTLNPARLAGTFVFFYWGGAMLGRFIGSGILRFVAPGRLLAAYACVAIFLLAVSIFASGVSAMWTVLAVGLFNSIMFPTIFTLAIDGTGENTAQASGILCTAIVGGAIIPPLYGALADGIGLQGAFLLPILCYLYIVYYGARGSRPRPLGSVTLPSAEPVRSPMG